VTYNNAERENIGWLVDTGLGMRFRATPHQVSNLDTNDVAVGLHRHSVFDIGEFYLLNSYSVISAFPVDKNIVGFDVYSTLIAVEMIHAQRMVVWLPV
jgi:hypothetical protein